jgi:hypothetical protein
MAALFIQTIIKEREGFQEPISSKEFWITCQWGDEKEPESPFVRN